MKVAIYSREGAVLAPQDLHQLCDALGQAGIEAVVYEQLPLDNFKSHKTFSSEKELDKSYDAVISLGGDGTLLDTVCLVRDKQIPVLGINYGRLGFLASLRKEDLQEAVDALKNKTFVLDKRSLVHLDASIPLFANDPFALNEFTIHKREFSPMIKIHTYLNRRVSQYILVGWVDCFYPNRLYWLLA